MSFREIERLCASVMAIAMVITITKPYQVASKEAELMGDVAAPWFVWDNPAPRLIASLVDSFRDRLRVVHV